MTAIDVMSFLRNCDRPVAHCRLDNTIEQMVVANLVSEIMWAKHEFLEAVKVYTDAQSASIEIVPGLSKRALLKKRYLQNSYKALYADYEALLNGFIIVNADCVNYNGTTYGQCEPVRRLTRNHLAFLQEKYSAIKDDSAAKAAYMQYKELVEEFLTHVKYQI